MTNQLTRRRRRRRGAMRSIITPERLGIAGCLLGTPGVLIALPLPLLGHLVGVYPSLVDGVVVFMAGAPWPVQLSLGLWILGCVLIAAGIAWEQLRRFVEWVRS